MMNMLVESRAVWRSALLLSFLVLSFGGTGLTESTDPDSDGVFLPDDQACSRICDCQLLEEDISSAVRSAVESLQPGMVATKAVHDQVIHASHLIKQNTEEAMNRLGDLEKTVSKRSRAIRRDIQAVTVTSKENLKDAEDRLAGLLKEMVTSASVSHAPSVQHNENASHCTEVQEGGNDESGVYTIIVSGKKFQVYCDLDTDGGGWTVIQRRDDIPPHISFYRGWDEYKRGFGSLTGEFWLGLDRIHVLTTDSSTPVRLRVDMEDWEGNEAFAEYDLFRVGGESDKYRLYVEGYNEGKGGAGDSLTKTHSGMGFTTRDSDNDDIPMVNSARWFLGAWWYKSGHDSNLNGLYLGGDIDATLAGEGVVWFHFKKSNTYSLKMVEMKVRPRDW